MVNIRQRKWASATVTTSFAVKVHKTIIESSSPNSLLLDRNDHIQIGIGKSFMLPSGGKVHRLSKNEWHIYSKKSGYVGIKFYYYGGELKVGRNVFQKRYVDIVVKIPHRHIKKSKGYCMGQSNRNTELFSHPYQQIHKIWNRHAISKKCKRTARFVCLNAHIPRSSLKSCFLSYCNKIPNKFLKIMYRIKSINKMFERRKKQAKLTFKSIVYRNPKHIHRGRIFGRRHRRHGRRHHRHHRHHRFGRRHHRRHHRHHLRFGRRHHRHHDIKISPRRKIRNEMKRFVEPRKIRKEMRRFVPNRDFRRGAEFRGREFRREREFRRGEFRREEFRREEFRREEFRRGEFRRGEFRREEMRRFEPRREEFRRFEPRREEFRRFEPRRFEPRREEPRREQPKNIQNQGGKGKW